jgi:predicted permease
LVLGALANKSFDLAAYRNLALGAVAVVLGSGLVALPVAKWLKVDYKTFVPPMMFNNSGNMGIPLAVLTFGDAALAAAVVLFVVETVLHFSLGVYILNRQVRLSQLLRMPMIIATLIGLAIGFSGWAMPEVLNTTVKMLGDVSIPLLLFSLGVRLNEVSFKYWRIGVWGAVVCPLSGLLVVALISPWLPLTAEQQKLLLIFGALPPAVLNFIVSEQYRQEPEKVASIVLFGTLGSLVVIPLVVALALR